MPTPTTKQALLDEIERSHQDLVRLLASLTDEEKVAPIRDNDWSAKDVLAHLVQWEKMAMDWMTRSLDGYHVRRFIPGFQYSTKEQRVPIMDELNIHLYEMDNDRTLADVMQDFRETHRAIFAYVAELKETDLFDPQRFAWRNGSPAVDMFAANTYEHYEEHGGWITEWRANFALSYPKTKQELLRRIRSRHAKMEGLLASLSAEQMTAQVLQDGWSVKDSLAHLAAWEHLLVEWVGQYRRREPVTRWTKEFPMVQGDNGASMNKFNAHLFEQSKARLLEDVLNEYRSVFGQIIPMVESIPDDELFQADHFPERKGQPLLWLIAGDTYEHYDEHLGWMRTWLAKTG